jgi:hypothetical protein
MGIGIGCDRVRGMTQHLLHDADVDTRSNQR